MNGRTNASGGGGGFQTEYTITAGADVATSSIPQQVIGTAKITIDLSNVNTLTWSTSSAFSHSVRLYPIDSTVSVYSSTAATATWDVSKLTGQYTFYFSVAMNSSPSIGGICNIVLA